MSLKFKAMSGSKMIVLSLQAIGENISSKTKTIYYKKSSDASFTEWTGDGQAYSWTHPYLTTWYFVGQHYQAVINGLEPSTTYQIYVSIDSVNIGTVTISTCALPPLWVFDNTETVGTTAYSKVQESIDNTARWREIAQEVGCHPNVPLKMYYVTSQGVRAECTYGASMGVSNDSIQKSSYDYQVMYHELRHYLGAIGDWLNRGMSHSMSAMTSFNGRIFPYKDIFYNEVNAPTDNGIFFAKNGTIYNKADEVVKFRSGSDLAFYNIMPGCAHDCTPDFGYNNMLDLLNWFILRALLFNDISIMEADQPAQITFTECYSYNYLYRLHNSADSRYLWSSNSSAYFVVPQNYSSIAIFVKTSDDGDINAALSGLQSNKYSLEKVSKNIFIVTLNDDTVGNTVTNTYITFTHVDSGITLTRLIKGQIHHLHAYAMDPDISDIYNSQRLKGAIVKRVAATAGSKTFDFYTSPTEWMGITTSTAIKSIVLNDIAKGIRSTDCAQVDINYNDIGIALSDEEISSGYDCPSDNWESNAFNTLNPTVTLTHPSNDPDRYQATVTWTANTTGAPRYFLLLSPTNLYGCPIFIIQNA